MLMTLLVGSPVNAPEIRGWLPVLISGMMALQGTVATCFSYPSEVLFCASACKLTNKLSAIYYSHVLSLTVHRWLYWIALTSWCLLSGYRLRMLVLLAKLIKICLSCI